MSWMVGSGPRRFAGERNGFHSHRRRYRREAGDGDGIIVLSPARNPRAKKTGDGNSAKIRSKGGRPQGPSTQKRLLKMPLKIRRGTGAARKDGLEMGHRLQQGIALPADRRCLLATQPCSQRIESAAQTAPQAIQRFQREGQPQCFGRGLDRKTRQQFDQPRPDQRSRHRVPGQHVRQEQGKGAAATAALPAIGAKHPLAPERVSVSGVGIIAQRTAVPVQRPHAAAMRTRRLLEGKSCFFNSWSSRTK
jgi:hypothetical protein